MHTGHNPYAQAGWCGTNSAPRPSIYGALPYPSPSFTPDLFAFHFTMSNPSILNSVVLGPHSRPLCRLVPDASRPGCTSVVVPEGSTFASINWNPTPSIEMPGIAPRQRVSDWLRLSSDRSSRLMMFKGRQYRWATINKYICLYNADPSFPELLGRISRSQGTVTLEVSALAMQLGLLEISVVVTVLLQSGRNID